MKTKDALQVLYRKGIHERIEQATNRVHPSPTPRQAEAGNYRMGRISFRGIPITIENVKGTRRREGWPPLAAHYGYIRMTEARDGDKLDVFLGPKPSSDIVFIIDQERKSGRYDEAKILLGYTSQSEAVAAYKACYTPGWRVGPVTSLTMPQFKAWLKEGDHKRRIAKQVSRYEADDEFVLTYEVDPFELYQYARKYKPGAGQGAFDFDAPSPSAPKAPTPKAPTTHVPKADAPSTPQDSAPTPTEPNFTGILEDALGRKYHFVDGKRVKGPQEPTKPRRQRSMFDDPNEPEPTPQPEPKAAEPDDEPFSLSNKPAPPQKKLSFDDQEKQNQLALLQHLDSLPGQQEMFEEPEDDTENADLSQQVDKSANLPQDEAEQEDQDDEVPDADKYDALSRQHGEMVKQLNAAVDGGQRQQLSEQIQDLQDQMDFHRPAAHARAQAEIDAEQAAKQAQEPEPDDSVGDALEELEDPNRTNYEHGIKISADSADELRKIDVHRVLDAMPNLEHVSGMADYIIQTRPDLTQAVMDAMAEIYQERGAFGDVPQTPEKALEKVVGENPHLDLANAVADKINASGSITREELWDAANTAHGGTRAEGKYGPSDAYDSMEAGLNKSLMGRTDPTVDLQDATRQANELADMVSRLPTQTNRSGNKDSFQQFSTPPHYAYALAWLANIKPGEQALEPSAGTGSIAVQAANAGAEVVTNELDKRRAAFLSDMFGPENVHHENAEQIDAILPARGVSPSVVLMNPPFSQTAGRMGDKKELMTGANHIEQGLRLLKAGGRLVAIVGRGMSPDAPTYRDWFNKMKAAGYNLRANVGVSGNEYKKYGTHFDTRCLVFDKFGEPGNVVTGEVDEIPALMAKLEGVRNDRQAMVGQPAGQSDGTQDDPGIAGFDDNSVAPDGSGVPGGSDSEPQGIPGRTPGYGDPNEPGAPGSGGGNAGGGLRDVPKNTTRGQGGGVGGSTGGSGGSNVEPRTPRKTAGGKPQQQPAPFVSGFRPSEPVRIEQVTPEQTTSNDKLGDSLYESYKPSKVRFPGAKKHPSAIVESAAMAAVDAPDVWYRPHLSPDIVEKGILSDAQLETVAYAGQAHSQHLPAAPGEQPARRGIFIGDGCVARGTRIFNPLTGIHTPIEKLVGKQHTVLALTDKGFEPHRATLTFRKGVADLYEVTLVDGQKITVTNEHRFLTPTGWRLVSEIFVGDMLASAEGASPSRTTSIRGSSEQSYSETLQDYPCRYSEDFRPCGEQLPLAEGSGQAQLPSPVDVLGRNQPLLRMDDSETSVKRILPSPCDDHHSKKSSSQAESPSRVLTSTQVSLMFSLGQEVTRRDVQQSHAKRDSIHQAAFSPTTSQAASCEGDWYSSDPVSEHCTTAISDRRSELSRHSGRRDTDLISHPNTRLPISDAAAHRESRVAFSSLFHSRWNRVASIEFVGRDEFFDMYVPGPENYVAEGFVNHNTGVGKGREICGVIVDNWNQGRRRHVWITEKQSLLEDSRKYWSDLGMDPAQIIHFDDMKKGSMPSEGVIFITYDTLKSGPRDKANARNMDVLTDWLGGDKFDGVIAFDESHGLGNSLDTEGEQGTKGASQRGLAGVDLQNKLKDARVLYVSATGATEVGNLAYAERLGIWGRGTPFADKKEFIGSMESGGVAAMEAVAQSLKATGSYMSRSLSFDDGTENGKVTYERLSHKLTDEQREIYDGVCEGWQNVMKRMHEALDITGGGSHVRKQKIGAFWGAQQRFFNQVITSMQTPSVIKAMEKDIAEGKAPVVQLVNTGGAALDRAKKAQGEDQAIEDVDVGPRELLKNYLKKAFPVHRYEEYMDENGNKRTRVVTDSQGKPVEDPSAVAKRNEMLEMADYIRVPDSPLDQIINHFGHENVAEATGRKLRKIMKEQKDGTRKMEWDTRPASANVTEADDFQSGRKKIMLFSDAGGTGRSYHADREAKNQGQRVHYMLQPGWRADKAVQGLGRTHRTNQVVAPTYRLVEIEGLKGQQRFISTIARRLDQLGALTRGQRQAGSSGLFKSSDNLESFEAKSALQRLMRDLQAERIPGMSFRDTMDQLGVEIPEDKPEWEPDMPMGRFLNRLLSMKLAPQAALFDEFASRMDAAVKQSQRDGTLDVGVENYEAESLERLSESPVYSDPATGATAKHIITKVKRKTNKSPWIGSDQGRKPSGYVVNKQSGQVWAAYKALDKTDPETGNIVSQYFMEGPGSSGMKTGPELQDGYRKVAEEDAKPMWEAEYKALPDFREYEEHFITGALLPIWDRIPGSYTKIYRIRSDDGKTSVGRYVQRKHVDELLRNLGATAREKSFKPADVHSQLLSGMATQAELANGWKLKPVSVGGERRIEVKGPSLAHRDELIKDGMIKEMINYEVRWFVPSGADGAAVLDRITQARPIVNVAEPEEKESAPAAAGGKKKKKGPAPRQKITIRDDQVQYEPTGGYSYTHPLGTSDKPFWNVWNRWKDSGGKPEYLRVKPTGRYLARGKQEFGATVSGKTVEEVLKNFEDFQQRYSREPAVILYELLSAGEKIRYQIPGKPLSVRDALAQVL